MAKTTKKPAKKAAPKAKKPAAKKAVAPKKVTPKTAKKRAASIPTGELRRAAELAAQLEQERAARREAEEELARARAAADPTRLAKLEEQLGEAREALQKRESELAVAKAEPGYWLRCPKCGGQLTEITYENVRVDRCESCSGVFFDAGEVEQLVHNVEMHIQSGEQGKAGGWLRGLFGKKKPDAPAA